MERCEYSNIVPENLPIKVGRRIVKRYDVIQCPYARARAICKCGHENFLDENSTVIEKIANTAYKHIQCGVCGDYYKIDVDVDIVCLCSECILVHNHEKT